MNCRKCGNLLSDTDKMCPNCGWEVGTEVNEIISSMNNFIGQNLKDGGQVEQDPMKKINFVEKEEQSIIDDGKFSTALTGNKITEETDIDKLRDAATIKVDNYKENIDIFQLVSLFLAAVSLVLAFVNYNSANSVVKIILFILSFILCAPTIIHSIMKKKVTFGIALCLLSIVINCFFLYLFCFHKQVLLTRKDTIVELKVGKNWKQLNTSKLALVSKNNKVRFSRINIRSYYKDRSLDDTFNSLNSTYASKYKYVGGTEKFIEVGKNRYYGYSDYQDKKYGRYYFFVDMDKKLIVTYVLVAENYEDIDPFTTDVYEIVKSTNIVKEFSNNNQNANEA